MILTKNKLQIMINKNNPHLAINGGIPISAQPILIHKPYLDEADFKAVETTTRTTFVSGDGPACREFEKKLSDYLGVKHVLFMNSATSALELAFRVKNFPKGSEVIVPNFTYTSTAIAAAYNDLKIVLADVYPDNGSIDVSKLETYITPSTVAIAPVDYGGIPADMDEIIALAKKYNLYVVHDTAQSIGSVYKDKKVGNIADADRIKILREKGTDKYSFLTDNVTRGYYEYVDIGNSYVQSNILGALGVTQLAKLDWMNNRRKEIAEMYKTELAGINGLDFMRITEGSKHNWHLFGILVPADEKYWIMDALRAEGVMANVHYTPLHRNKYYQGLTTDKKSPGAMEFFSRLLRLPIYPSLSENEIINVITAVKKVFMV